MNVFEAVTTRNSVRAYKSDPVAREALERIIEAARAAPSWCNSQPWEFTVAAGEPLQRLRERLFAAAAAAEASRPDFPYPESFPEKHEARRRLNGKHLYTALGIARDDREARAAFNRTMFRFFDAPAAIIVTMDRGLSPIWSALDVGCALQSILLTAHEMGLGTCAEASIARYPDLVRAELGIEERLAVLCGVAVGRPADEDVRAAFRSPRAPAAEIVRWVGF